MAGRPAKKKTQTTVSGGKPSEKKVATSKGTTAKGSTAKGSTAKGSASTVTASRKSAKEKPDDRHSALKEILLAKREALIKEIKQQLGQSVTDEQQRRLEAAMDSGDQALVDLDREMGISLQEMRNRERQLIDDALDSLDEGTYGVCADCGGEINEKRLQALPFARLCVACKTKGELMEKIERSEQRQ
jgi:DnaK suppressor protein